jgi:ubiquitin-conjugating enzyme E2 G1
MADIAAHSLNKMYRDIQKNPSSYFSCGFIDDNIFRWRVTIIGQEGTLYSGGFFPTELVFPEEFPNRPPKMKFLCPMYHPNIGEDGTVCISILHEPELDPLNPQETLAERWLPVHSVESIVVSVISMLEDPNPESPLNVKANRDFLFNKAEYKKQVRRCVNKSIEYC